MPAPVANLLSVFALLAAFDAVSSAAVWRDAAAPIDARVASLLAEMSIAEKSAQTVHLTSCDNVTAVLAAYGTTSLGACPLYAGGAGALAARNALQTALMSSSRLAIPLSFHTESLHGACGGCVIFPMPAGQASSWDVALVQEVAGVIAAEAWATGIDRGFSPELNVPGDPRFGRTEENFSEDPALVAAMGVAAVLGLHSNERGGPSTYLPPFSIVSEAKHAAAYAYGGKDGAPADISERTLHDVYLRPWAEYAAAGGRGAMLAHNAINAVPCHSSQTLMSWLRAQGNFSGALLASDMCDVGLLGPHGFRVAADLESAAVLAMSASLDQELCNAEDGRGQAFPLIPGAIAKGLMPESALDRAASSVLRAKFAAGLFDSRALVNDSNLGLLNSPAHREVARRAAAEGIVLLKNENNLLPLTLGGRGAATRIAVIGPLAGCADNSSDCVATRSQCGGYTSWGVDVVSVLAAALNETGAAVTYTPGADVGGNVTTGFAAALAAARAADVVLFVGGDSGGLGWNANTCGEDDDRALLELPGVQAPLLAALGASGTPVVAVLIHGRPVTFRPGVLDGVGALLAAWRPGAEGGHAVMDVLTGRVPPSGRLAQSWVRSVGQVKSEASPWYHELRGDFGEVSYNGDIKSAGWDDGSASWAPAWPFGAGLSYTTWAAALGGAAVEAGQLVVRVNLTNTGAVASKQVVGVYYSRALSAFVRHHQRLFAFTKTLAPVAPGATVALAISAPVASLASYDAASQASIVEPGVYTLTAGFDSASAFGTVDITI